MQKSDLVQIGFGFQEDSLWYREYSKSVLVLLKVCDDIDVVLGWSALCGGGTGYGRGRGCES